MKRFLATMVATFMLFGGTMSVFAQEAADENDALEAVMEIISRLMPDGLTPGPHVIADPQSPTGFTVAFVYQESYHYDPMGCATNLTPLVQPSTITSVILISETMLLYDPAVEPFFDPTRDPAADPQFNLSSADSMWMTYQPEEFRPGLVPAGGSGFHALRREMVQIPDTDLWVTALPLPSGAFEYRFIIDSDFGEGRQRLDDPANPTMHNTETGVRSLSSMVFVPWAPVQGDGQWANRANVMPRDGQNGTVVFASYEVHYGVDIPNLLTGETAVFNINSPGGPTLANDAPNPNWFEGAGAGDIPVNANFNLAGGNLVTVGERMGSTRGLAIYLPYNYDANRAQPYNILFISMGASGDAIGNEMRWFHEGAGVNILDNLFADGAAEPFIMVSGNWQDVGYNINQVSHDIFNYIIPYMETNFNVATTREGRAFAGLSMGGILGSHIYLRHAEDFSQFGLFSAAVAGEADFADVDWDLLHSLDTNVVLTTGRWDFTTPMLHTFAARLADEGLGYTGVYEVPGGHDWQVWQLLLEDFVANHLWQAQEAAQPADTILFDGQEMVPLREVAEAAGAIVNWDHDAWAAIVIINDITIVIPIGEPLPNNMGTPIIINDRTFVPADFINELFGG
ncbi:MAG: alpha/beta hydrolase-fold protein [Defluviitaleaceae bacterium]|nr:alpha/beta hydrolase-fold protein [Defluviitaleaceae bacterium]